MIRLFSKFSAFEQKLFIILVCLGIVGTAGIFGDLYRGATVVVPARGAEIIEGTLGQPLSLNPLVPPVTEADEDLRALVHAGLLIYDNNGTLRPNLAESLPEVSDDLKVYTIKLRDDIFWQDGVPITVEDVMHTIKSIQDKDAGSHLRASFVFTRMEQVDERTLVFRLREPAVTFPENLLIPLIPEHVSDYNGLYPVGAGPYKIKKYRFHANGQVGEAELEANKYFKPRPPYIEKVTIKFYNTPLELTAAYRQNKIRNFGLAAGEEGTRFKAESNVLTIDLPQYQALFFNQEKSTILKSLKVRQALTLGTNREEIIEGVYTGNAKPIGGPIVGDFLVPAPDFSPDTASKLLEEDGWHMAGDGLRYKSNEPLSIVISTNNSSILSKTADILKSQWGDLGINVQLQILNQAELADTVIRTRQYEALLLVENIGHDPDPFPFWHSSQTGENGLNFSQFKSIEADRVIVQARTTADKDARDRSYLRFVEIINNHQPALFLVQPSYIYVADREIKNLEITKMAVPYERFSQISNWYIKQKRAWKLPSF